MATLYGPHCEAIDTHQSKSFISHLLSRLGPQVRVVGSQMTETGYTIVLEGPKRQVMDICQVLHDVDGEEVVIP